MIASLLVALSAPAFAQSAEAEQLFRDGDRLMAEGKTEEACVAFEGSNRIEPRAGTLIRLGDCRLAREQLASAWSAYTDALSRAKDPKKKKLAQQGAAKVEGRLSRMTITVPTEGRAPKLSLTRNGEPVDSALWSRPVPIDGGHYEIVIQADGYVSATRSVDVPVEKGDVVVEVPALVAAPAPVAPVPSPVAIVPRGVRSRWTTPRRVAIGAAGVGIVTLGAGIVFGLQASARENDALDACPDPDNCGQARRANDLIDSAHRRATLANVMFGVAGVAVAGAVVLWFVGAPSSESEGVALVPSVSADGLGVTYAGRF